MLRRDVAQATPQQIRQALDVASRLNPGPWGGDFREVHHADWKGAEVTWKDHDEGTVVWVHGGAFAFGSPRVYRAGAVHLAKNTRCRVILPEYRLAPEHVFPAAHNDVFQVLKALGASEERTPLVVVGDSAGGNLVLGALQRLRDENRVGHIRGLALLSPWCDLRMSAKSIQKNAVSHSPFDHADSVEYSQGYLASHDASDPLVSALAGASFRGFPPMYLEWAEDEFLAPDIALLQERLERENVDVFVRKEPEAIHGWQTLPDLLPEARRSSRALGSWVRQRLGLTPLQPR